MPRSFFSGELHGIEFSIVAATGAEFDRASGPAARIAASHWSQPRFDGSATCTRTMALVKSRCLLAENSSVHHRWTNTGPRVRRNAGALAEHHGGARGQVVW